MPDVTTPQFDLPFRLVGRGAAVTEQDEEDNVLDCVQVVLRTSPGFVVEQPDYGVADLTFGSQQVDVSEIQTAITQWEPRADVFLDQDPTVLDELVADVRLQVEVRSDNA